MIEASAPGKLFVVGEYAVVVPGEPAVLIAVDRLVTVRLTAAEGHGSVRSDRYGRAPRHWRRDDLGHIQADTQPLDYVFAAIEMAERLRAERQLPPRYYDIDITSELDDASGRKFGLGSSGAVTTAVIAALDQFYGLDLSIEQRFRLALLATITVAPRASGGDIAASTYRGWVRYVSPDRDALAAALAAGAVTDALVCDGWGGCTVERLPEPTDVRVLVGWTGSPAATDQLVEQTRGPVRADAAGRAAFLAESHEVVDDLVAALAGDGDATDAVRRSRRLLQRLAATSGTAIETPLLTALCDAAERHGAAGKPSGAGGGDCGIVLADAACDTAPILRDWQEAGVLALDIGVQSPEGAA